MLVKGGHLEWMASPHVHIGRPAMRPSGQCISQDAREFPLTHASCRSPGAVFLVSIHSHGHITLFGHHEADG